MDIYNYDNAYQLLSFYTANIAVSHAGAVKEPFDSHFLKNLQTVATGIFVGDTHNINKTGSTLFRLVTNRHLVDGLSLTEKKNALVLINTNKNILHKNNPISENDRVIVPLEGWERRCNFHHNKNVDIISLPFPVRMEDPNTKERLTDSAEIPDKTFIPFNDISEGDEVYYLGYPSGLGGDFARNHPVLRKGIISQKDEETKTFLIDGFSFPGSSGGPVFLADNYSKEQIKAASRMKRQVTPALIGIVSHSKYRTDNFRTRQGSLTLTQNLGLTKVFSTDLIKETFGNPVLPPGKFYRSSF